MRVSIGTQSAPALAFAAVCALTPITSARAEDQAGAWTHEVVYTADVTGVLDGGRTRAGRYLDNLDLILDGDLERAVGWSGAKVHL